MNMFFERLHPRPLTVAALAAGFGVSLATSAVAQSAGYYTHEDWWEVDEWFDGDDVSYREYDYDWDDDWWDDDDWDDDWDDWDDDWYDWNDDRHDRSGSLGHSGQDGTDSWDYGWYETGYSDEGYRRDYQYDPLGYDYYSSQWHDTDGAFSDWYDGWIYSE